MERKIPKNVHQIGNVSDTPKIYVEDYVDTFFSQLSEVAKDKPIGAFLVGDIVDSEEGEYVFIHGAIQMHELKRNQKNYILDEETWEHAKRDFEEYFEEGELIGWIVASSENEKEVDEENETINFDRITKLHKSSFPKEHTILIMKNVSLGEEQFYVHKLNQLMEIGGHFTYYEKNPSMQNYMISCRKKNGVCPTEVVEDQAAKNFRSIVRTREQYTHPRKRRTGLLKYLAHASVWICLIVCISLYISGQEGIFEESQASGQVYIVKEGDSLIRISNAVYGDRTHIEDICKKNGLTRGSLIYVGQKLILP